MINAVLPSFAHASGHESVGERCSAAVDAPHE